MVERRPGRGMGHQGRGRNSRSEAASARPHGAEGTAAAASATAAAGATVEAAGETLARGAALADELLAPWLACLEERLPEIPLLDCHTHLGSDADGAQQSAKELIEALDRVQGRAIVFPLRRPSGYRQANDRILAIAEASEGRLIPFCRVDPHADGLAEAQRSLDRGAAGIKLHPRAERFSLSEREVDRIASLAHERRVPMIVHAGQGIPSLGRDALTLAAHHRAAPIILAHAAVSDLAWIWRKAAWHPNLFFDTAWWNPSDQLALFALIPPGQILFGSDAPYGRTMAAAAVALRGALASGLQPWQIAEIAGGQLQRLLTGQDPLDIGPPTWRTPPAPGPLLERLHTLLIAAIARILAGDPAADQLELARLACRLPASHPDAEVAASVAELLARYERIRHGEPPSHRPRPNGIHLLFLAAAVARMPEMPLPDREALHGGR